MAHIRPVTRKNSRSGSAYEVRWRDENGRERQRTLPTKQTAEAALQEIGHDLRRNISTAPHAARGKTVAEVVGESLAASRPRLKPGTYAGYEHLYRTRILPAFGERPIARVTSQEVELWIAGLIEAGKASSTIHNHFVALNKVFRYALRHRLIAYNPCEATELPKMGNAEGFAPIFLTAEQVEALGAELDSHAPVGALIRFAAKTGLRSAEIAGLRVRDVNLAAGHIEVRQTIRRVNGAWVTGTPKSARSSRNVPLLSRALIAELRELKVAHPDSGNPDALFWPAVEAGSGKVDWSRPMDVGGVRRLLLLPTAARLGIAPHMRFHDLRHTFASLMLAADFKAVEVSRWMGHASVATTDGIYGHLYVTDYVSQIDKFERFVSEA